MGRGGADPVRGAARSEQRDHLLLSALLATTGDLVVACDIDGRVTMTSAAMQDFAGLGSGATAPQVLSRCASMHHADGTPMGAEDDPLARTLRGEEVLGVEMFLDSTSGQRRSVLAEGRTLRHPDGETAGAMVWFRDMAGLRDSAVDLPQRALHDPLTGLPNRTIFVDRVRRALERARRPGWSTAVLAINLDRFAAVANRLGQGSADQIVSMVAQRLEAALRPYDSVSRPTGTVARLGGDQFLVLCEHIADASTAESVVARLATALHEPMGVAGAVVRLTAGIGYTLTGDADRDPEALILEAETAMRRAKQRGTGLREQYAAEMRSQFDTRIDGENDLHRALAHGEFRLAYQPKISLATGRVTGVEALLRWDHPERGVIPPLEFIPLAEESGLIVPIGSWVLEQVCRDAQRWRGVRRGAHSLTVAVNVSPRQFQSGLAETFGAIIERSGIEAASLCLELTEGIVMQDTDFAIATLRKLKSLGLRISVDDFGTGFSSLAYLKRFPLDELKIDKSFVDGLGMEPEDTAIVAAIMGMAHALDLHVVAEGVETAEQAASLHSLGCDEAQGYYYARPGPAAAIDDLLIAGPAHQPRPGAAPSDRTRAQRILVIDDSAVIRQLARASLAAAGYEVAEAGTGEEALALIGRFEPDCVLLDVNLPGISGLDVCRALRDDQAHRGVTVVILSGDGGPDEKALAFAAKADDYVVKPASPRDLVQRVTAAMRRSEGVVVDAAPRSS